MKYILLEKNYYGSKWHKVGTYRSLNKAKYAQEKRKKTYKALTNSVWEFKVLTNNTSLTVKNRV